MGNRLKEIRDMRGLKVTQAAARLGITRGELYKLERGERRLTDVWAKRLARVYEVAPQDLLSDEGLSVAVKYLCARQGAANTSRFPTGEATGERYVQAPDYIVKPEDTFGFEIMDRHAEGLHFPPGTRGLGRPLDKLGRKLKRGDRVVVHHFATTRGAGKVAETLVGLLDRAVNGDLLVLVVSETRESGGPIIVRRARRGDPPAIGDEIEYEPRDDDFAEILGVPLAATVPL